MLIAVSTVGVRDHSRLRAVLAGMIKLVKDVLIPGNQIPSRHKLASKRVCLECIPEVATQSMAAVRLMLLLQNRFYVSDACAVARMDLLPVVCPDETASEVARQRLVNAEWKILSFVDD